MVLAEQPGAVARRKQALVGVICQFLLQVPHCVVICVSSS